MGDEDPSHRAHGMHRGAMERMERVTFAGQSAFGHGNTGAPTSANNQLCVISNANATRFANATRLEPPQSNPSSSMGENATASDLDMKPSARKFKLSEEQRASNRERQRRYQNKKKYVAQADQLLSGPTANQETAKIFFGDIRGQGGCIIEVKQLSKMKNIAGHSGRNFVGAIVQLPDGSYTGIEEERFLVTGENHCYAKHGTHDRAHWILAKRLTRGAVDGYVWIQWSNGERAWVPKSRFMPMATADRRDPVMPDPRQREPIASRPSAKQLNQVDLYYQFFKTTPFLKRAARNTFDIDDCLDIGDIAWEDLQKKRRKNNLEVKRLERIIIFLLMHNKKLLPTQSFLTSLPNIPLDVLPHESTEKDESKRQEAKKERKEMIKEVRERIARRNNAPMGKRPKTEEEEWHLIKGEILYQLGQFVVLLTTYYGQMYGDTVPYLPDFLPERESQWRSMVKKANKAMKGRTMPPPKPSLSSRPLPDAPRDGEDTDLFLGLSLTFDIISGRIFGTLGDQVDAAMGATGAASNKYIHAMIGKSRDADRRRREKEQKEKKAMAKPRTQCKIGGCTKLVHKMFVRDGHCYVHGDKEKKMCIKCKENTYCRAGKLCRECFDKANNGGTNIKFCTVCRARKVSNKCKRCPECIDGKRARKKKKTARGE